VDFYFWVLLVFLGIGVWAFSRGNNELEENLREAKKEIEALREQLRDAYFSQKATDEKLLQT
jgi:cbb3-type cytochrome oxidase subunit 3